MKLEKIHIYNYNSKKSTLLLHLNGLKQNNQSYKLERNEALFQTKKELDFFSKAYLKSRTF